MKANLFSTVSSATFPRETRGLKRMLRLLNLLPLKIDWPSAETLDRSSVYTWFFHINTTNLGCLIHFSVQLWLIGGGIRDLTPFKCGWLVQYLHACWSPLRRNRETCQKGAGSPQMRAKGKTGRLFTRSLHNISLLDFFFFFSSQSQFIFRYFKKPF